MLISIFFILIMFVVVIVSIGATLLRGIVRMFFGQRGTQQSNGHSNASQQRSRQSQQNNHKSRNKRDKIFDKTDGEYVDFEEL